MTDRLDEIKARIKDADVDAFARRWLHQFKSSSDVRWLVGEVERLRRVEAVLTDGLQSADRQLRQAHEHIQANKEAIRGFTRLDEMGES